MRTKVWAGIGLAVIGLGLAALAALPTFKSLSGAGNAATPAEVDFVADVNSQIRVIGVWWQSDTNAAALSFTTGAGAYSQTATNVATSSVTNQISGTNGLVSGQVLCLQHSGALYFATLSAYNQSTNAGPYSGTNIVLGSGGWGVAASPGDDIFVMSSATTIPVGVTTNAQNGEGLYVGNYGRPVRLQLTPALTTNRLLTVTAHYDSASQ